MSQIGSMPSKGADPLKVRKIIDKLREHPEGLWIRELARQTELDKSTVSRYLSAHLGEGVTISFLGRNKLVKLK